MVKNLSKINTQNVLAKYNFIGLKKKINEIKLISVSKFDESTDLVCDFSRTKPRPDIELLKKRRK